MNINNLISILLAIDSHRNNGTLQGWLHVDSEQDSNQVLWEGFD